MSADQPRSPAGSPAGGQYAVTDRPESGVDLAAAHDPYAPTASQLTPAWPLLGPDGPDEVEEALEQAFGEHRTLGGRPHWVYGFQAVMAQPGEANPGVTENDLYFGQDDQNRPVLTVRLREHSDTLTVHGDGTVELIGEHRWDPHTGDEDQAAAVRWARAVAASVREAVEHRRLCPPAPRRPGAPRCERHLRLPHP